MSKLKKLTLLIMVMSVFTPAISHAQLDSRCWTEKNCNDARGEKGGFVENNETKSVCGETSIIDKNEKMGFCSPLGKSKTQIIFGGKKEFTNMGDFIQNIYSYSMIITGILAVIMIIVAGAQITMSGGSPDRINSAKKRISGAVVGLTLVAFSYVILNTINPYLVNLRLPQVWMIRPQGLDTTYCDQLDKNTPLQKIEQQGIQLSNTQKKELSKTGKFETATNKTVCGFEYLIAKNNEQTCQGTLCTGQDVGKLCTPNSTNIPKCEDNLIAGKITAIQGFLSGQDLMEDIINEIDVIAICKDGTFIEVAGDSSMDNKKYYGVKKGKELATACGEEKPVGFFMGAEINDANYIETMDTLGIDDWFAIGQLSKNSHRCNVNLSKLAFNLHTNQTLEKAGIQDACSFISIPKFAAELIKNPNFLNHLISLEELENGYICDITVSRNEFPDIDNAYIKANPLALLLASIPGLQLSLPFVMEFNFNGSTACITK